uniref:Uncharacterized protein n=1 Tax=Cacopsylla melanoneura TaxID=428564 RepID=A0A8D8ZQT3_9HEMI
MVNNVCLKLFHVFFSSFFSCFFSLSLLSHIVWRLQCLQTLSFNFSQAAMLSCGAYNAYKVTNHLFNFPQAAMLHVALTMLTNHLFNFPQAAMKSQQCTSFEQSNLTLRE